MAVECIVEGVQLPRRDDGCMVTTVCELQIGPRMELEVVKVEEGMCDGRVLFHAHVQKSDAERAALQERKETAVQLKEARRKQQVHRGAWWRLLDLSLGFY